VALSCSARLPRNVEAWLAEYENRETCTTRLDAEADASLHALSIARCAACPRTVRRKSYAMSVATSIVREAFFLTDSSGRLRGHDGQARDNLLATRETAVPLANQRTPWTVAA